MKLPIIATAICALLPLTSHAVCTKNGHIERVTAYNDGAGTYHYIYMRTSALSNTWWYARTSDDEMAEIATTALTSTTRVALQGDASSCPTSGSGRYTGSLRYLVINP